MCTNDFSKTVTIKGIPINGLYSKEYEDPRDSAYLNALKLNKGFDQAAKLAIEYSIERKNSIMYTGSNVRVTQKNMPYLYSCVAEACQILNVVNIPEVYVLENPCLNAFTTGSAHPILVFHNSILQRLTHEELMFVIGHEIGHIKSEHLQYTLIGDTVLRLGQSLIDSTIIGSIISSGLNYAFYEWERRAEFTADHAGLLVCQDLKSAISALAKLGGYPVEYYETLNVNEFLQQAQDFSEYDDNMYNKLIKLFLTLNQTHPWTVLRARELMLWVQRGEYSRIIHRCSAWLEKEIDRCIAQTDKAWDKHERSLDMALSAYEQSESTRASADAVNADAKEKKGVQYFLAKGQSGIRAVQAQMDENASKRKQSIVEETRKKLRQVEAVEKQLRSIYTPICAEAIDTHTTVTIGDLLRITENASA